MAVNLDYNASVISKDTLSSSLVVLRILPDFGVPDFRPGQYTTLGLYIPRANGNPHFVRRTYSIASSPLQKEYLEFYIVAVESGELSSPLANLKKDDRVFMGTKFSGHFTLDEAGSDKNLLLVGTGTGLAPYMSMLRTFLPQPQFYSEKKIVLLHGARNTTELGYYEELSHLQKNYPQFVYWPALTRQTQAEGWNGLRGRVNMLLSEGLVEKALKVSLAPEQFDTFLCGNPQMIEETQAFLEKKGFKPHQRHKGGEIFFEKYW